MGASIAQLVDSRSCLRKDLSSRPRPQLSGLRRSLYPQSLRRNLNPEIPQVFRTSAAPVQE